MSGAIAAVRSIFFYAVFYAGSALFVMSAVIMEVVAPSHLRVVPDAWSRFHRRCLAIVGIKVRQLGEPPLRSALYAIKHESFFDAIELPTYLDHPVPFAKQELFSIPGWGRAARAYGAIEVARSEGARALREMLAQARRYTSSGRPLAIFPEGTRVPVATRPPLQAGFAGLYKMLALPVAPVAIDSGALYHRWVKRPGTITIAFGPPIPPGLPRGDVETRVRDAINALNSTPG